VAEAGSQRSYRAPCPGCGAPVEFLSAASTHAVCSYCQSTVVRDGETLSRIGKMAELFDDHSPLQLMAAGRWQDRSFTLVGRLQYRSGSGTWTEWIALFGDGATGVLAEDNGSYVFAWPSTPKRELPPPDRFRVGARTAIDGKSFQVASNDRVALISAQGELPKLPPLDAPFAAVELRAPDGEVLSIDFGSKPPLVMRGSAVQLDDLQLTGLREESVREAAGRQFSCPHCGAQVQPQFGTSKAITCSACHSIIDLTQGVGGELRHAVQDEPVQPLIALGSKGKLQGVDWQVVGYQHRIGHDPQDPDESFGWDEYLLYNRKRGFSFLVDSTEGWSLVKPVTGAPRYNAGSPSAYYLNTPYYLKYSYQAETTYVAGEFYWPVERGQKTFNRDFFGGKSVLSLEESANEQVWSLGGSIGSAEVAKAFQLAGKPEFLKRSDAGPTSGGSGDSVPGGFKPAGAGCGTVLLVLFLVILLIAIFAALDDDRSGGYGYRSSGGSFGGYSSGGSHK
jgi:endogenous inhibitor of DNA gyrase (YacG/DUF329 family)